ncbi:ras association domain-containing protein 2 isoform X1 [Mirounga leonina]|uniref:ras association domain-containing protein 2 isoform X1 n=1 Tax=Mirounga leonina TaxID=9715 RepID=UPI00156BDEF5|nr:ras association domain-containing protein 2 isoform X1 [Mirounga leonina]XP_034861790.1 ras association domain-containing protein 2 isoform X1 [Mirounga leonina]XP_034861791.1 ras association domain-containing protein 2 isoform X1 [Mirounga leonina]
MDYSHQTSLVPCGQDKYISKNELLLHLKTYNLYYEGQNLQLRHREEEDEFIVEGLLNISWGLRRPIRLQMQDDNERIRPPPSSSSWHSGCNLGAQGTILKPLTMPSIQISEVDAPPESEQTPSPTGNTVLMKRISGEAAAGTVALATKRVLCANGHIPGPGRQSSSPPPLLDSRGLKPLQEDTPQLMRTRSDVGVRRRGNVRTPSDQRRIRRHRFSINGHFYNHKTSVFTPAYGSVTNVRINSTMTTPQVLKLLLNKFKIENSAEEFALYVVHTSGEKQKLKNTDYPLVARILQGPCEQVSKVFLMEKDQVEEVTYDVAQYIKFEMPVLKSFIQKLQEEEDREVKKLMRKYTVLRLMIRQRLEEMAETPATI